MFFSGGSVKIASPDPFTHPIIDPAVYTNNYDIEAMVQAIRDVQTFLRASTWQGFVISPYGELANATTDESLAHYARKDSTTVYHPVGTARMSSYGASWGVVNPDLLVKGVSGLRIVDASVFVSCIQLLNSIHLTRFGAAVDSGDAHSSLGVYTGRKSCRIDKGMLWHTLIRSKAVTPQAGSKTLQAAVFIVYSL